MESNRDLRAVQLPGGLRLQAALHGTCASYGQADSASVPAQGQSTDQSQMVLFPGQPARGHDLDQPVGSLPLVSAPLISVTGVEPGLVAVGYDMQVGLVPMRAQEVSRQLGRNVDVPDVIVEPESKEPVDGRIHPGQVAQWTS